MPYLTEQKVNATVVFADGLDQAFHVASIPTIIVLDRSGKIAYRTQGYAPDGFVDAISAAITKASAGQRRKNRFLSPRVLANRRSPTFRRACGKVFAPVVGRVCTGLNPTARNRFMRFFSWQWPEATS